MNNPQRTPAWSADTARKNRAFNRKMDRVSIAILIFAAAYMALHMFEAATR